MIKQETSKEKIKEFFELLNDEHYDLRKYSHPVLVYKVEDERVYYTLWEESILKRFGTDNIFGWDYDEDLFFCPDWVTGIYDDDDDDFDDDDDD
ncbi:MAG: hypothetical protein CSB55_02675 [Candidatus Cloacimonadota bacterium]|nr:MAG: hypothetical protein CSB55_02675 [Candidatus Cloacimonadota bacterium]